MHGALLLSRRVECCIRQDRRAGGTGREQRFRPDDRLERYTNTDENKEKYRVKHFGPSHRSAIIPLSRATAAETTPDKDGTTTSLSHDAGGTQPEGSRQPGSPCLPTAYDPMAPPVPHGSGTHPKIKSTTTVGKQQRPFLHHKIKAWLTRQTSLYDKPKKKRRRPCSQPAGFETGPCPRILDLTPFPPASQHTHYTPKTTYLRRRIKHHYPRLSPLSLPPWRSCKHIPRKTPGTTRCRSVHPDNRLRWVPPSRPSLTGGSTKNGAAPRLPPPILSLNGTPLPSGEEGTFVRFSRKTSGRLSCVQRGVALARTCPCRVFCGRGGRQL